MLITFAYCFLSVFESFKDYVATEQLDGDNKYDAGEHGLQVRPDSFGSSLFSFAEKHLFLHISDSYG